VVRPDLDTGIHRRDDDNAAPAVERVHRALPPSLAVGQAVHDPRSPLGRAAIVGVGAGHVEAEFEALGLDFASRGERLNECIDAMRDAFATEQRSTRASSSTTRT
jgi:hypothetical protein